MHEAPDAVGNFRGWRWGGKVVEVPLMVLLCRCGSPGRVCE